MLNRIKNYYLENETKVNIIFFLSGVAIDIFTISDIDSLSNILQQMAYLFIIGHLLYFDFLDKQIEGGLKVPKIFAKIWVYRDIAIHFSMGALLSIYSIFFIKSASIFSSFAFIFFMISLMIVNETKYFQNNKINFKIGLYLICIFSFFSMLFPILLGFVGWQPFALSLIATLVFLLTLYRILLKKIPQPKILRTALALPGMTVLSIFGLFYYLGWIPPVPLSTQEIGIYHGVEKIDGNYVLKHETPSWMFWLYGDQNFVAQQGDEVFVFVRVFSPAKFSDHVILHWQLYNHKTQKWMTTDRIVMKIIGGRRGGYRGYASKKNYQEGDYRILVETNDGREISRLKFQIEYASEDILDREFYTSLR